MLDMVVGTAWGDEGKGHVTHWLAADAALVARATGGPNAGHTIVMDDQVIKLHQLPTGVLHPNAACLLGAGMVINLESLAVEIDELGDSIASLDARRLYISDSSHLILPGHVRLDQLHEKLRAGGAIGTTGRGIGPTYVDKARRMGVRASLLRNPTKFRDAVIKHTLAVNEELRRHHENDLDLIPIADQAEMLAERFGRHVSNGVSLIHQYLDRNQLVIAEGAQGAMLDIDHGTYPYVTSTSSLTGGIMASLGIGPRSVRRVIGIAKAFNTRVGSGPFPTEIMDKVADQLRGQRGQVGAEFGTTTGRPRRCGWLDLVALRHACKINGVSELVITKLDQLSGIKSIPICEEYRIESRRLTDYPEAEACFAACAPVYTNLPGWSEDLSKCQNRHGFPEAAKDYLRKIQSATGVTIMAVSVGPDRSQLLTVN